LPKGDRAAKLAAAYQWLTRPEIMRARDEPSTAERAFRLSGAAPLAVFVVLHTVDVSRALSGRQAWSSALARAPWETAAEMLLVWLPLLFHVAYGAWRHAERGQLGRADRGWAWAAVAFIAVHAYHVRLPVLMGTRTRDELFTELCASLSATGPLGIPTWSTAYVVGLLAVCFHFARGVEVTIELLRARECTQRERTLARVAAALVFVWGVNVVVYFATGTKLLWIPPSGLFW
jgi:succinate dehydrogenase / fumarate reductase cytochrome b subunit